MGVEKSSRLAKDSIPNTSTKIQEGPCSVTSNTQHVLFLGVSVTIVTVGVRGRASLPSMRSAERTGRVLNNVSFFPQWENYNSQKTIRRRGTASRCGSALSPPPGPAFLLVPSSLSECVSVTQRRCEAERPSGGAAAAAAASTSSTNLCSALGFASSLFGSAPQSGPHASPSALRSSALGSAANFPLPGLAGWPGRRNAALSARVLHTRHTSPPRSGSRSRAGIPATSNCPVSVRGEPREGSRRGRRGVRAKRARNFIGGFPGRRTGSFGPPARPRAGGGREPSLRRLHPAPSLEEAPLSGAGPALPPPPSGSGVRGGRVRAQHPASAACCGWGAPRRRGGKEK